MNALMNLVSILQNPLLWKVLLVVGILWILLFLACWICGLLGLFTEGTRQNIHSRLPGCLPLGQIYYTMRLAGKKRSAAWSVFLIWWWMALTLLGITLIIWALVLSTKGIATAVFGAMAMIGLGLMLVALICFIALRALEFIALAPMLIWWQWIVSLITCLLCLPVQRIFLFLNFRKNTTVHSA